MGAIHNYFLALLPTKVPTMLWNANANRQCAKRTGVVTETENLWSRDVASSTALSATICPLRAAIVRATVVLPRFSEPGLYAPKPHLSDLPCYPQFSRG
jgi:hypothetical protein